jgi:hypothetical protein
MDSKRDWPNSGILFKNTDKREERDRDYQGTVDIDCPHCGERSSWWLSSWIKSGAKGKFMSLSFRVKSKTDPAPRGTGERRRQAEVGDPIPF